MRVLVAEDGVESGRGCVMAGLGWKIGRVVVFIYVCWTALCSFTIICRDTGETDACSRYTYSIRNSI